MARKNLLAGLTDADEPEASPAAGNYPMRGASKNMIRSLDELAKQAEKFLEGDAVVELDPETVDGSFVSDRLEDGNEQFEELKAAIEERGQDTPILVRPHPVTTGRYQVVFGHRRLRVARELGRKVKAVVKPLDDRTHVIAQGQENSARANLSFIERAAFARRLIELGYDRAVISSALAANAAAVSKMASVTERIPESLIVQIGAAPSIGRERWVELSLLIGKDGAREKIGGLVESEDFIALGSDERFNALVATLNKAGKPVKKVVPALKQSWQAKDQRLSAEIINTGRTCTVSLKAKAAGEFGRFLSNNLDRLYAEFQEQGLNEGD
ncbi:plasmid partitioning protein RepB [Rhizobium daejeonense]|uniref:Plasmid partitioning protein RepB n=1 Tax=Rhizobium daejeonense TaxID=240521 RepID=A0A6M1S3G5_9HYPH|nr:plasmid partitioning protein RepB [Rhizobium daejeonense]NGO65759.1 plasmid partitioning protein RepB [Rhizobium daejeonense]